MYGIQYKFLELSRWLILNGYTVIKFSKLSKISIETIYKLLHGGKVTIGIAQKLSKATKGQIPIEKIPLVDRWGKYLLDENQA